MKGDNIKDRTKSFAVRVLKLANSMPKGYSSQVIAHQIIRSSTSVGANYRAASRSKSRKDFLNKMKIVEEELDETIYWLELIIESAFFPHERILPLINEANEIMSIIVKSIQTAKANEKKYEKKEY